MNTAVDLIDAEMEKFAKLLELIQKNTYSQKKEMISKFKILKSGNKELLGDKLGYEMANYIQFYSAETESGVLSGWEQYFSRFLEHLIAIVFATSDRTVDFIDRQCLISRIYCWYSDQLAGHKIFLSKVTFENVEQSRSDLHSPQQQLPHAGGFRVMSDLPWTLETDITDTIPASNASPDDISRRSTAESFAYIETGSKQMDDEIYRLWMSTRKQEALEQEAKAELEAKLKQHKALRRPYSAGATQTVLSRLKDSKRPQSAMKELARRVVSLETSPDPAPPTPSAAAVASGDRHDMLLDDATPSAASLETIVPAVAPAPLSRGRRRLRRPDIYMYLSDSDDDAELPLSATIRQLQKSGQTLNRSIIAKERPPSAKVFSELAAGDPELKVLYRHTNYRRMPLTVEQVKWVEEQERIKKVLADEEERQRQLAEKLKAAKEKGKAKVSSDKGTTKVAAAVTVPKHENKNLPKIANYPPAFDSAKGPSEANGPMREREIDEVQRVESAFRKYSTSSDTQLSALSAKLRTVLITPQDRPQCISLFNIKAPADGLRSNPLPLEQWRKFVGMKTSKKSGKKKKKAA